MTGDPTLPWSCLDPNGRLCLSVQDVAARLDHRLHAPEIGVPELKAGCQLAVDQHLAAVTCRPEHVPAAAGHLAGSPVGVVTGLGFGSPGTAPTDEALWLREARAYTDAGATELAVIASAARLQDDAPRSFLRALERLLDLQDTCGYRLRVHLDPTGLSDKEIVDACRQFAAAGVWMVQSGTWQSGRAGFRLVVLMREALGTRVRLKWTTPVGSLHLMLLGVAEGVDRFNADVTQILTEAARQSSLAPLLVPKAGLDY